MSRVDLERIHQWVTAKLSAGHAVGRVEHQYLALRETVEGILTKFGFRRSSAGQFSD